MVAADEPRHLGNERPERLFSRRAVAEADQCEGVALAEIDDLARREQLGLRPRGLPRAAEMVARARDILARERGHAPRRIERSEEHTAELQSLMRISYHVFCLNKKIPHTLHEQTQQQ